VHLDQLPGSFFGPANLVDLLQHRSQHQGRDCAFIYLADGESEEQTICYAEVDRRARSIAAGLQQRELAGQRALLLYSAGLDFVTAFFGCMYAGVVAVTAYPPRRNRNMDRIEAITEDADAAIALTTSDALERVAGFLDDYASLKQMEWLSTDRTPEGAENQWQKPDVHGETLALLQYTSGSTGTPKGVMLSHANLMHNSAMICYAFEHTRSGVGVFWLPSYHDMGLIGGILQPMYYGRPNVLFSPASFLQKPYRWLRAISHYRGTVSGGPNFAYDLAIEKITEEQIASLDLSSWSLAFNGAEPIRPTTIERFCEKFGRAGFRREAFYPCYGLAEATLMVTGGLKSAPPVIRAFDADALENHEVVEALPEDDGSRELVGCGGNLMDQQVLIVDPQTKVACPPNRVGEIWVAGPSVAQGYWKRPDETQETFGAHLSDTQDGPFLRTGDLGFLLDGELFVTGRLKDLIIIRGVNHYPQDIEDTVQASHASLRKHAGGAFTIDVGEDQRLVVVQEVERRRDPPLEAIFEAVRRSVAAGHDLAVEAIVLIRAGSMPKTSSGKVQRHACRQGYLQETLSVAAQWRRGDEHATAKQRPSRKRPETATAPKMVDDVASVVFRKIRKVAGERAGELSLDTNVLDLGLDSLQRMEVVALLEDEFGGRLPAHVVAEMETCREVVAAIEEHLQDGGKTAAPDFQIEGEIPDEYCRVADFPEYKQLRNTVSLLQVGNINNPFFRPHEALTDDTTEIDGKTYVNFCSYNYLGMSGDPQVSAAAKAAVDRFGTSVSASRLVSGEKTVHRDLEKAITQLLGTEDTVCFVGGHATNVTTVGHLFNEGDLVLHDELAHNSIVQGCILSGARRRPFAHNDWQACSRLLTELRRRYRRVLIAIEGVYSMDGDYPDLPRFVELRREHKTLLLVDEAHSIGTMGQHGGGMREYFQLHAGDVDLWMGTLSKSFGSTGGYISGSRELVEYLKYTAPGFVFSVGMPPANAAAALASINLLREQPERVERLARNSELFLRLAREHGLNTGSSSGTPIVPVIIGNSLHSLMLSQALFDRGINVQPILYPAVEESAARLRFFITSSHSEEQIRSTVDAVAEELRKISPRYLSQGTTGPNGKFGQRRPAQPTHPSSPGK